MAFAESDRGAQAIPMDWNVDQASDSDSESSGAVTPTAPTTSGTSSEPPGASVSSPLQSPGESSLDAAVHRLLKNQPAHNPKTAGSESREAADAHALDNLDSLHSTGDTLVVVDFPTNAPQYVNCAGTYWRAKTFRAPSAVLLATGSSFFAKLYSPRAQARVRRRIDPSKWGHDIEYVLDLTPSSEGDELAAQLAELSIPEGVRNWWLSMQRLGISRFLVSGHDDHCLRHVDVPIEYTTRPNSIASAENEHIGNTPPPRDDLDDIEASWLRMIPDYCPVRHRVNIIRLIRAILGEDLILNSAARVYTISGIARQFDCAGVVRDSVFTWLVAQPNSDFIDIEPEAALRIGWNLGLRDITRMAMRIIVAENTMDALSSTPRAGRRYTLLGRARAELPDELENIIQHATAKFAERLTQIHADLASPRVYSLLGVGEWKKLMALGEIIGTVSPGNDVPMIDLNIVTRSDSALTSSAHVQEIRSLYIFVCKELLNFLHTMVEDVDGTSFRSDTETNTENSRLCYVPRSRFSSYFSVWHSLSTLQRGMLTDYWRRFSDTIWAWTSTHSSKTTLWPATASIKRLSVAVDKLNSSLQLASKKDMFPPLTGCTYQLDLDLLKIELATKLVGISRSWAYSKAVGTAAVAADTPWDAADLEIPISRSLHLVLGLTDEEFKYLPLWAGGLDDGTGGVFHEPLPDAEMGPIGPGPAYHTGYSVLSSGTCADADVSSIAPSDAPTMSMLGTEEGDDFGFGGVGRHTADPGDGATPTSGRSRVAVPTGSTVTGTRAASPYAPSSVMTPSEGWSGSGSVISLMTRDVRTMRLATASVDGNGTLDSNHNTGKMEQQSVANDVNEEKDDGDDDEDDWSAPSDDDGDLDNYM